jgi:hypothetical protein
MGLVNYYHRYVKGFNAMVKPLNMLLKLDQEWQWGDEQERAFVELKAKLVAAPILRRPIRGCPFQLHIDWSMLGLGAVLTQCDDEGKEFVVAYASRSNNDAESRYSLYEGECLAIVWVVTHFRCYLFGTQFTLVTDHQPLKWLMEFNKLTGKLAQWALILQEYDFQVVHRPGVANLNVDGLSRNPCTNQEDNTGTRWHGEVDEEMVPGWHASAFLCLLGVDSNMEGHVTSYSSQRVDGQSSDLEVGDGNTSHHDVHDDTLVLEFLRTNMVPSMVNAKEKDRVLQ